MSEDDGARSRREVLYNLDRILDAHTHLTGMEGESTESILECMDFCGIDKVFLFAPMLDVGAHQITSDSLEDIRTHNDYCADLCSKAPERLLGFCTLNPMPTLADGDLGRAVGLMVEEAERCYHELGLRGAGEIVPTHWFHTTLRSSGCGEHSRSWACTRSSTQASSTTGARALTAAPPTSKPCARRRGSRATSRT